MTNVIARVAVIAIAVSSLARAEAQEKPAPAKVDPPKLADVLRENEALKREVDVLRRTVRDRDARLQLAAFEREGMVRAVSADAADPDGSKAIKVRCDRLEAVLRAIEHPKDDAIFQCDAMTFAHAARRPE